MKRALIFMIILAMQAKSCIAQIVFLDTSRTYLLTNTTYPQFTTKCDQLKYEYRFKNIISLTEGVRSKYIDSLRKGAKEAALEAYLRRKRMNEDLLDDIGSGFLYCLFLDTYYGGDDSLSLVKSENAIRSKVLGIRDKYIVFIDLGAPA